jgi:hypothetical protein
MSCYQTDKNLQYTKKKHLDTYSVDFFIDNTSFLSTQGTALVPRALVTVGSLVEGGVCPGGATATVTIKLRSATGSNCSSVALAVPLDRSTATVGTPCPLAISSTISSSTVPLVCLGFRELLRKNQEEGGKFNQKMPKRKQKMYSGCNEKHSRGCSDVIPS